jgi:hypothetical protein
MKKIRTLSLEATYKELLGMLFASLIPSVFSWVFAFKFSPLTEGWWHVYAKWIQEGRVPYKDFELLVPPLYPNLILLFESIGLGQFHTLRAIGILLIGVMSLAMFFIIRAFAPVTISSISTATAMVYLQTGTAFINYDYVLVAIFFQLLAFLPLALFFRSANHNKNRNFRIAILLSGFFGGLTLLTKQSNGVSTILLSFLLILLLSSRVLVSSELKRLSRVLFTSTGIFSIGLASSLSIPLAVIVIQGAFESFLEDVGPQALFTKGGLVASQTAWVTGLLTTSGVTSALLTLAPLIVGYVLINSVTNSPKVKLKAIVDAKLKTNAGLLISVILAMAAGLLGFIQNENFADYFNEFKFLPAIFLLILLIGISIVKNNNLI